MEIFPKCHSRKNVILKCLELFCFWSCRLQIWGIQSTCGSLSAVKALYYLRGSVMRIQRHYLTINASVVWVSCTWTEQSTCQLKTRLLVLHLIPVVQYIADNQPFWLHDLCLEFFKFWIKLSEAWAIVRINTYPLPPPHP